MENEDSSQLETVKKFEQLHKVTPLSKYLAMALFVALPFLGGWVGYMYAPETVVEVEKLVEVDKSEKLGSELILQASEQLEVETVEGEFLQSEQVSEMCFAQYEASRGMADDRLRASTNLYFRPYQSADFILTLKNALQEEALPCTFWTQVDTLIYSAPSSENNSFYYYASLGSNLLLVSEQRSYRGVSLVTYVYNPNEKSFTKLEGYNLYQRITDDTFISHQVDSQYTDKEILKVHTFNEEGYEVREILTLGEGETFDADCDGVGCTQEISYSVIYGESKLEHEFKNSVTVVFEANVYSTEKPGRIRPEELNQYLLRKATAEIEF
jgi:hypothetical protein